MGVHNSDSPRLEDHFGPHCFRHWFTTWLLRNGMPREYVKELRRQKRRSHRHLPPHRQARAQKSIPSVHTQAWSLTLRFQLCQKWNSHGSDENYCRLRWPPCIGSYFITSAQNELWEKAEKDKQKLYYARGRYRREMHDRWHGNPDHWGASYLSRFEDLVDVYSTMKWYALQVHLI